MGIENSFLNAEDNTDDQAAEIAEKKLFEELRENPGSLEESIENIVENLNGKGIVVDKFCQIDIAAFEKNPKYSAKIEDDKKEVERLEGLFAAKRDDPRLKEVGNLMELFKTAVFNRVLGKGFIVCRSSKFDDYKNNIDNIIIRESDGKAIGAFDDAVKSGNKFKKESKERFEEKKGMINRRNEGGGGRAKYCYGKNEVSGSIIQKEQVGIPLFYLDLTYVELLDGVRDLEQGKMPDNVIDKFFSSMNKQMELLEELQFDVASLRKDFETIAADKGINIFSDSGYYGNDKHNVDYGERQGLGKKI